MKNAWCVTSVAILLLAGPAYGVAHLEIPRQLDNAGFFEAFYQIGPHIYLAGQPSPRGLLRAAQLGTTKVINLRTSAEMNDRKKMPYDEVAALERMGIDYLHIPSGGIEAPYAPDQVQAFAQALSNLGEDDVVLLHCGSGRRAAHLWVAYLIDHQGLSYAEATDIARKLNIWSMPLEGYLGRPLDISPEGEGGITRE